MVGAGFSLMEGEFTDKQGKETRVTQVGKRNIKMNSCLL